MMKRWLAASSAAFLLLPSAFAYKGELLSFKMNGSAVYPGTQREIQVYVPAAYDGKTPACLLVRMDGGGAFTADILDELIAELCPDGVEYKELQDVLTIKNGSDYKGFDEGDIPV